MSVYQFMVEYQQKNQMPPTLAEIVEAVDEINWRSSARHTILKLQEQGLVEECGEVGCARRYKAVNGRSVCQTEDLSRVT